MFLRTLLKELRIYTKDLDGIVDSYKFASETHKKQKRASGEQFIQHPLNVAYILAELKLDDDTIAAALLHDVLEDTGITLQEMNKEFGSIITTLVDGVTKITVLKKKNFEEYYIHRKIPAEKQP